MAKLKFLVVDDQSSVRKFIVSLLADYDADITQAADGQDALDIITQGQVFDLIFTDIDMPNVTGIKFCERLKEDPSTQAIPVIMISTFDSEEDVERGFTAGAAAYISKADVQQRLASVVESTLSKSKFRCKRKILVVDDSPAICLMVKDSLLKEGFEVLLAGDGKEALAVLETELPDMIISDIVMPEMDGLSLCREVKKDPRLNGIPFVVMSVRGERRYMKRMVEYGAAAYLVKPFNMEELLILIDKILSDHFLILLKEKEKLSQERDMMLASITGIINALEARDICTRGHSETVAEIVTGMASFTEATEAEIERLSIGARLHDVGKIGIRDDILFKEGKLTPAEYEKIKAHPRHGATIVESIPSLVDTLPIILHHHERYDGSGYPDRLKGEKIPFWARMVAVADTYDAMVSTRPYRRGVGFDDVLETIADVSGTQLCPECVDLFMRWISEHEPRVLAAKFG